MDALEDVKQFIASLATDEQGKLYRWMTESGYTGERRQHDRIISPETMDEWVAEDERGMREFLAGRYGAQKERLARGELL